MNEKKKIKRVKKSDLVPKDISEIYEGDVLENLREKVKKEKEKNEKKSKELIRTFGTIKVIRFS